MKKTTCRLCKSEKLKLFLDLGFHPHSDQFRKSPDEPETQYPLRLMQCQDCAFVQLDYVVEPETLYTKDYLYESSITQTANAHWEEFVESVTEKTGIKAGHVVDIGSNDGTLLSKFKAKGFTETGIDPCPEVVEIANSRGVVSTCAFWGVDTVIPNKADLITGTNVFAHVDDLDGFITAVKNNLKEKGAFVFESPYLGDFLNGLEYDTVYHQHLSYLSLNPLIAFFKRYGMEVFDVQRVAIHGGCFRVFVAREGQREISSKVFEMANNEYFNEHRLSMFASQVSKHRAELMTLLYDLKNKGKKIAIVSTPAKGMTLMNYCGIDKGLIDFATEKSNLKIGRYTPGSHILIEPDSKLKERQPDYALLLAWNFAPEIMANNKDFKGKWIVPLPEIKIYDSQG